MANNDARIAGRLTIWAAQSHLAAVPRIRRCTIEVLGRFPRNIQRKDLVGEGLPGRELERVEVRHILVHREAVLEHLLICSTRQQAHLQLDRPATAAFLRLVGSLLHEAHRCHGSLMRFNDLDLSIIGRGIVNLHELVPRARGQKVTNVRIRRRFLEHRLGADLP